MTPQPPTSHFAMSAHRRGLVRRAAIVVAAVLAVGGTPLVAVALGGDTDDASLTTETAATSEALPTWSLTERARPSDTPPARVSALENRASGLELDADPLTTSAAVRSNAADAAEAAEAADAAADAADAAAAKAAAEAVAEAAAAAAAAQADAVAAALVVLADTYQWDERSTRVAVLQQTLGVEADGWYAWATLRAHRGALEAAGMYTGALPVPPAPVAAAPSGSFNGPSASAWAALRNCESGGNYSITNPSGKYRGAYQFDQSTWNSVAQRHAPSLVGVDPAAASPSSQDLMAQALYSERGSDPWPQCGRHL